MSAGPKMASNTEVNIRHAPSTIPHLCGNMKRHNRRAIFLSYL